MKTTKSISVIGLALMFFAGLSLNAQMIPVKRVPPSEPKPKMINYTVRIEPGNLNLSPEHHYIILMTDASGRPVDKVQNFIAGVWDYQFFEAGPVRGTRVARMVKLPLGAGSYDIPPTARSGFFTSLASYLFIIRPLGREVDPPAWERR